MTTTNRGFNRVLLLLIGLIASSSVSPSAPGSCNPSATPSSRT